MPDQLLYAIEAGLNGLMAGVLYSLVALGFVLIFKASGLFNYAQGVLFAALARRLPERPDPLRASHQRRLRHRPARIRLAPARHRRDRLTGAVMVGLAIERAMF